MENVEEAKRIRKYYFLDDRDGSKRSRLGDNKIEVNVLLKPCVSGNLHHLILPYLTKFYTYNTNMDFNINLNTGIKTQQNVNSVNVKSMLVKRERSDMS